MCNDYTEKINMVENDKLDLLPVNKPTICHMDNILSQ